MLNYTQKIILKNKETNKKLRDMLWLAEPKRVEGPGLIGHPGGAHVTVTTWAPGTEPQDEPFFPCPRPEAAGREVGERPRVWREAPAGG